jgi:hypothetical protein
LSREPTTGQGAVRQPIEAPHRSAQFGPRVCCDAMRRLVGPHRDEAHRRLIAHLCVSGGLILLCQFPKADFLMEKQ